MALSMEPMLPSKIVPESGKARREGLRNGWRRRSESNRCIEVLQTSALPLGYAASPRPENDTVAENSTGGAGDCQSGVGPANDAGRPPAEAGPQIGAGNGSRTRD